MSAKCVAMFLEPTVCRALPSKFSDLLKDVTATISNPSKELVILNGINASFQVPDSTLVLPFTEIHIFKCLSPPWPPLRFPVPLCPVEVGVVV